MAYIVHDTAHVGKRARERDFTTEQAIIAINEPGILKTPPRVGNHGGMIWLFSRQFGNRILIAVAEVKNHECWLITAYWQ